MSSVCSRVTKEVKDLLNVLSMSLFYLRANTQLSWLNSKTKSRELGERLCCNKKLNCNMELFERRVLQSTYLIKKSFQSIKKPIRHDIITLVHTDTRAYARTHFCAAVTVTDALSGRLFTACSTPDNIVTFSWFCAVSHSRCLRKLKGYEDTLGGHCRLYDLLGVNVCV